jgi:hypothetical protein
MLIKKGVFVENMKDKTLHAIIVKWNEFVELLKIELDESQKEFQRGSYHIVMNFEGFSGHRPTKKHKRRKQKLKRKRRF